MAETPAQGSKQEQSTFSEVYSHYEMARNDLDQRRQDWDKKDKLFRSYIDPTNWPYKAQVFDPRVFTTLYEKTARLLANKPQGRLIPREGGDALGAKICNELLMYQWDDNERVGNMPMLAKWGIMDQNARKYGAAFGLAKWHWERQVLRDTASDPDKEPVKGKSKIFFDGPDFRPLNNRDCLPNPGYSQVKNWFQHRDYLTLRELEDVNDVARSKPVYKNLDLLKQSLKKGRTKGGDTRESNYSTPNLSLKGLQDYLGRDESATTVEVITEYRPDRWIVFAPKHGVILRDIPNPYDHGQIPIVHLRYYPIDEDIYGLSEIEPVEKLQRAINALVNQYLDTINMSLYAPLKVRSSGVQMHTLEFGPGKKWIMNDPQTDVMTHDQNASGVQEFASTYRFLVGAMQEALGETSAAASSADPGASNKTATEIKDSAISRSARDNYNLIFLGEALKKQMMFWHTMDKQLLFSNKTDQQKIIQITGKDAVQYFKEKGLDGYGLSDEDTAMLATPEAAASGVRAEDMQTPNYPVKVNGDVLPKMTMDDNVGHLILEKEDLSGVYDYIPDIGSMNEMYTPEETNAIGTALQMATGVDPKTGQPTGIAAMMQQEGKKVKATDLFVEYLERLKFKDAEKYIEDVQANPNQMMGGVQDGAIQGGTGLEAAGAMRGGAMQQQGMAGNPQAMAFGQAGSNIPGPATV